MPDGSEEPNSSLPNSVCCWFGALGWRSRLHVGMSPLVTSTGWWYHRRLPPGRSGLQLGMSPLVARIGWRRRLPPGGRATGCGKRAQREEPARDHHAPFGRPSGGLRPSRSVFPGDLASCSLGIEVPSRTVQTDGGQTDSMESRSVPNVRTFCISGCKDTDLIESSLLQIPT